MRAFLEAIPFSAQPLDACSALTSCLRALLAEEDEEKAVPAARGRVSDVHVPRWRTEEAAGKKDGLW